MNEINKQMAEMITRTLATEGGKYLVDYFKDRIISLDDRAKSGDNDISVENVETQKTKSGRKTIEVTIIKIEHDTNKIEAGVLRKLLKTFSAWEELAGGKDE